MANFFRNLLGKRFPDTRKYEAIQDKLSNDFHRFQKIAESSLFQRYQELDREIHSGDFEKRVNDLKHKKFKDTGQYQKLQRYKELNKSKDIRTYLKFKRTGKSQKIEDILSSDSYKRFRELEKKINTPGFYQAKVEKDFKKTDAFSDYKEYKKLKKNRDIKWAVRTEKSDPYLTFKRLDGSDRVREFYDLKSIVESKEFKDFKEYMEDRNRFKKSDEAVLLKEYAELKKHGDIVWYFKKKDEKPFEELKKWELTFSDEFDGSTLDSNKWITGYYWGKALMNDTYSLEGEKQLFSDDNVELRESCLRITTRQESVSGKEWSPVWGFRKKNFDFTSGLISTGQSFRQQYGRFEAKVRFNQVFPVMNAFWMVGERITPHIDIFKSMYPGERLLEAGLITNVSGQGLTESTTRVKGARFTSDFFIYTLDWSANDLVWKVNGVEVFRQTENIPKEPMYLTFCTTLPEEPRGETKLPAIMEISWVRCYKRI